MHPDPQRERIALFRYRLIAEALNPRLRPRERGRLVREVARLHAQREELERVDEEPPTPLLPLGSLMEGWRTEDRRVRHDLVAAFFDELDVLDGAIVSVVPRAEFTAEVAALLEMVERERSCSPGGTRGDTYESVEEPQLAFG